MIIFLGNDKGYEDIIAESKPHRDIVVSCQYRHRVPKSLIQSHTCVNIHYGLLPRFAGCYPIYWQIMAGGQAGVTLHYMDESLDTGDIIDTWTVDTAGYTADELYSLLARHGRDLFAKHYKAIINGTAPRTKQDLSLREYKNAKSVNWAIEKYCDLDDERKIRALHFQGKQYAVITLGGNEYEVRRS